MKQKVNMTVIKIIDGASTTDNEFLHELTSIFNVNQLCELLGIDRNRYNYLKRTKQLDKELLKLREVI